MKEKIEQILINETVHIDSGWDETKWIPQNKVPEIAEAISALFPRWISVEKRLPEDDFKPMLLTDGKMITIGHLEKYSEDEDDWAFARMTDIVEGVTHWMDLPELPKE